MSRIKELREKHGYTQEKFGILFGMSQQTVSKIENNTNKLDVGTAKKISQFFQVSLDYLLENIDQPQISRTDCLDIIYQSYPHIYQFLITSSEESLLLLDVIMTNYLIMKEKL